MNFGSRFTFGTKAETLKSLEPRLTLSTIPEFVTFTRADWKDPAGQESVLERIDLVIQSDDVIVRSSAAAEDNEGTAMAGVFCSVGPVARAQPGDLRAAVEKVLASYSRADHSTKSDQVLVQRMIRDVSLFGVIFTQDMSTGAPYYVLNYDDETGATDTVTAGSGYANRTLYIFRDQWSRLRSERFRTIIAAIQEIEEICGDVNLDIEFALDRTGRVHLFQVRRITTHPSWNRGQSLRITDALNRIEQSLRDRQVDEGDTTLGSMPDWNPAEMIGATPRPLALSLYRTLITDSVWSRARGLMGYRRPRGKPLMTTLAGQPYIDVKASFESFLPAGLNGELGDRLVTAWLDRLKDHPHLHDKVEFDVAITAMTPDFDNKWERQCGSLFSESDRLHFKAKMTDLTNELLNGRRAPIQDQLLALDQLERRRIARFAEYEHPVPATAAAIVEDTIELGTTPFAILARHGFIATSILDGLLQCGVLSSNDVEAFRQGVTTVASDFIEDIRVHASSSSAPDVLLQKYGHLRPGTYDILSKRYDQEFADAAVAFRANGEVEPRVSFVPSAEHVSGVNTCLKQAGLEIEAAELFGYMATAIQAREHAKFVFTHSLSDLIEVLAAIGVRHGLSREELSYIPIDAILDVFVEPAGRSTESQLRELSVFGAERHQSTLAVRLPSLIYEPSDVWIIPLRVEEPNFVTRQSVSAEVVHIAGSVADPAVLDHKIVAITSADPGFDWIFTRPIAGLVTRYGGVNSHMAIRCAEFGLPAAIGCGEQIFDRILDAERLSLNCASGQLLMSQ